MYGVCAYAAASDLVGNEDERGFLRRQLVELGFDFASYGGKSVWLKYGSQVEILVLDDADMYVDDATKKIYFHGGVVTIKIDGKRALPPQRVKSGMINRDDGTIYCNGKELGKFKLPKP